MMSVVNIGSHISTSNMFIYFNFYTTLSVIFMLGF